jgi:hypothetical protein
MTGPMPPIPKRRLGAEFVPLMQDARLCEALRSVSTGGFLIGARGSRKDLPKCRHGNELVRGRRKDAGKAYRLQSGKKTGTHPISMTEWE